MTVPTVFEPEYTFYSGRRVADEIFISGSDEPALNHDIEDIYDMDWSNLPRPQSGEQALWKLWIYVYIVLTVFFYLEEPKVKDFEKETEKNVEVDYDEEETEIGSETTEIESTGEDEVLTDWDMEAEKVAWMMGE